jgi:uncharacterized protein (DUF488 family)
MAKSSGATTIWSIGHSNHPLAVLVELLGGGGIEVVADLRSQPRSRFNPQFDRRSLERALAAAGFRYVWLGDALGGRPTEPELRDRDGQVDYASVAATDRFHAGIDRLLELAAGARLAMMCSEADPRGCHRRMLVTPALTGRSVQVIHLMGDGTSISEEELASAIGANVPPTLF